MQWTYQGKIVEQISEEYVGFVYLITNLTNDKKYIGKKLAQFKVTKKPLKGKKNKRRSTKESDWRDYWGSSDRLQEDVDKLGPKKFTRQILSLHSTLGKTNFEETRQLFFHNVLTESLTDGSPAFYNSNILGRYYRKDYFDEETLK